MLLGYVAFVYCVRLLLIGDHSSVYEDMARFWKEILLVGRAVPVVGAVDVMLRAPTLRFR